MKEVTEEKTAGGDSDGELPKPMAAKLNKNMRRWQKRAMYGKPERATGLEVDNDYKNWYIDQRDLFRVQLPEPIISTLVSEAVQIVAEMRSKYVRVLGPQDELVYQADARIEDLQGTVETTVAIRTNEGGKLQALRQGTERLFQQSRRQVSMSSTMSSIKNMSK